MQTLTEIFGGDLDEEAALAAVDQQARKGEYAVFDADRQGIGESEGTGAADLIAGQLLRPVGIARLDAAAPELAGENLGVDALITMH